MMLKYEHILIHLVGVLQKYQQNVVLTTERNVLSWLGINNELDQTKQKLKY